jgi:hypothetical protein
MQERLDVWCPIADQSAILYLKTFAKSLRSHRVGICNYAKYKLNSARIEARGRLVNPGKSSNISNCEFQRVDDQLSKNPSGMRWVMHAHH